MPSLPTLDMHKTGDGVSNALLISQNNVMFVFWLHECHCPVLQCITCLTAYLLRAAPVWCLRHSRPAEQHTGGRAVCSLWSGVRVGPEGAETTVWWRGRLGSLPNWQPLHQQQVFGSAHYYNWHCNRQETVYIGFMPPV